MKLILPILLFSICAQAQTRDSSIVWIGNNVMVVSSAFPNILDLKTSRLFQTTKGNKYITTILMVPDSTKVYNIKVEATVVVPTPPPTVTVNIDDRDPSIKYTGGWDNSCKTCIENYNSTITFSNVAGSTFEYTFTGKSITWIGERVSHHGIAGIKIDSQPEETYDLYSAQPKKKEIIFKKGWETSSTHKVVVRVTGQKNTASSGFYVVNDMFIVEK